MTQPFTLTMQTDPKTIMFEGHPEIEIVAISDRNHHDPKKRVAVYIEHVHGLDKEWQAGVSHTTFKAMRQSTHANAFYKPDGTLSPSRFRGADEPLCNWPRIVPRLMVDVTKPIIATGPDGKTYRYELVGTFTPANGKEPIHHVTCEGMGMDYAVEIYASTGKVIRGLRGSTLQFSNGPFITTEQLPVYIGSEYYTLDVTKTDGVITNINWKAN